MTKDFEAKLDEYAKLLVEVGLNVRPGQTLSINASLQCADLARRCVSAAYDRGAREVLVDWGDDFTTRQWFLRADEEVFSRFPPHKKARYDWLLAHDPCSLSITGGDPELLKGVDARRLHRWGKVSGEGAKTWYDALMSNRMQWCVAAYPTKEWARMALPDREGEEAIQALWDKIFQVCRVTGDGEAPQRWQAHIDATARRAKRLNDYNFKTLRYRNSLGTDLTVPLPENHVWMGGADVSQKGTPFVANIPTEEIFTAPHRDGARGRVYASMPLSLDGNLVKDFYLDLKDGKIVDAHAGEGEEYLRAAIGRDEGAAYLGEVALVPYDSPIKDTGILFYNTLFDENASCHLAFGAAYPNCVKGGEMLDEQGQKALGLNQSNEHVDFMVGTRDLSIVGVTGQGEEIPVFVDGNFAF